MNILTRTVAIDSRALLAASAALGLTGPAFAQQPTATAAAQTKRQTIRADFFAKLAQNLHVTVDQLKSAVKDAELQTVDDMQADGTMTADQAAKLKDRINSGNGLGLARLFAPLRAKRAIAIRREIITSAAAAINIPPKDLRAELQSGKSIADVAAEHSVPLDTVKSQITDNAKARLDKAVANGRLTQAKEDAALEELSDSLDEILSKHRAQ